MSKIMGQQGWSSLKLPAIFAVLLLIIWVGLPQIPESTRLQFGQRYQIFFTVILGLAAIFFWFLGKESIPYPKSSGGVIVSLVVVFLMTVGLFIAEGHAYPNFQRPLPPAVASEKPNERGEALFWSETGPGCFRCHSVGAKGTAIRGPNQGDVATRAAQRASDLGLPTAEQYLLEKVRAGLTYRYTVPGFVPMMPPFGTLLSEDQITDLVAYLLTLK